MRVIEVETNASLTDLFAELTPEPVAAASIGQVPVCLWSVQSRYSPGRYGRPPLMAAASVGQVSVCLWSV